MTTTVEKSIVVDVPVSTVYNQWTQFADFPQFMSGITSVETLGDDRMRWHAEIAGVKRQWEARVLEQIPDRKVAWAATEGATNAGSVVFTDMGTQTSVTLHLEYEPEGLLEKAGDALNIVGKQAEGDLERFKAFIESEGYATGAWRGTVDAGTGVGTPGTMDAAASMGDDGKDGISLKTAAAGIGVVAAAAAVAAAATKGDDDSTPAQTVPVATETTPATGTAEGLSTGTMGGSLGDDSTGATMEGDLIDADTIDDPSMMGDEIIDVTEQDRMRSDRR
ncbi:MAG TPA: SRPBCC family protein [Actinomycetales bacterium]|jgi:uncharacterized protein YndB with AHSA1/START domain